MTIQTKCFFVVCFFLWVNVAFAQWAEPKAPVIPQADGYVLIPDAVLRPDPDHVYKTIFEATKFPSDFNELLPALNNAGSELNAFSVEGVPEKNWKFVVVFHGPAINGILDDNHYKEKYGVSNPNLKVLSEFRQAGVELFVCGQNLAFAHIDPASLTPDVRVASDALIVLMTYQNNGYALLSY
jgi:intracellular sulfur oxidation DsrE/DsrF family protein